MIKTTRNSFTLIELVIVIAILGIIAFMISGNLLTSLKKGRDAKRKSDLENIQKPLEMYYEDNKMYPAKATLTFGSSFTDPVSGNVYMKTVPNDPIVGKNYTYESDGQTYQIYACLENDQQMLSIISIGGPDCSAVHCKDKNGDTVLSCTYGVSSPNSSP